MLTLIFSLSCGEILGVRDAAPPTGPSGQHRIPAVTPDDLIANLESAFAYREFETYVYCLGDSTSPGAPSFHFIPAASAPARYPGKFTGWATADEQSYFQSLAASCPADSVLELSITEDEPYTEGADTVDYQFSYLIRAGHNRPGSARRFSGKGVFRLVRDAKNDWVISSWEDIETGDPSWSDLKAVF